MSASSKNDSLFVTEYHCGYIRVCIGMAQEVPLVPFEMAFGLNETTYVILQNVF
jgi:hypothetical protein